MCGVFRIKTLTPIWTGGVDGECTKLRETSIIGSLRWWFEVIVRGFGGYACDSVGEVGKKCELDVEKYKKGSKAEELVCPVCYVFGTTNWARRFRIEVKSNKIQQVPYVNVKTRTSRGHRGWYLGKDVEGDKYGGLHGCFDLDIHGFTGVKDVVCLALNITTLWGIGTKTQDGFGICTFNGKYDVTNAINEIKGIIENHQSTEKNRLKKNDVISPNLKDFFFIKVRVKADFDNISEEMFPGNVRLFSDHSTEKLLEIYKELEFYPTAPLIRYWLRGLFQNGNDDLRHFLFGFVSIRGTPTPICKKHLVHTIKEDKKFKCNLCGKNLSKNEYFEKIGSKIFVSHIYKVENDEWEFKIWGYVPEALPQKKNREDVLQKLFSEIKDKKNFADILKVNKDSVEVEWYEVSQQRSNISSVEELIKTVVEVNKDERKG